MNNFAAGQNASFGGIAMDSCNMTLRGENTTRVQVISVAGVLCMLRDLG